MFGRPLISSFFLFKLLRFQLPYPEKEVNMQIVPLRSRFFRWPKFFIAFLLPLIGLAQVPSMRMDTQKALSDTSLEFPESARIKLVDKQTARLDTEVVTVQPGDYVVSLLAGNGIRQDTTALALLYDLNPQLDDIRKIEVGEKIVIPTVEGNTALESALRRGYRIELLINHSVATQALGENTYEMKKLETKLASLADERFDSPQDKTEIMKMIAEVQSALATLATPEEKIILSRKVATQAAIEGDAIRSKLSEVIASDRKISMTDLQDIKASGENLIAIGREVSAGGSGLVRTIIRTKSASNGEPVSLLTVWYAPEGNRNRKSPCSEASSPSTEAIARGKYVFWATRGNEIVTDEKPRAIRSYTKDIPVDLLVR